MTDVARRPEPAADFTSIAARGRALAVWSAVGPAFVASVAYVDPGNFVTNFGAGAQLGYKLLWVVILASAAAVPIQYLSAKLGIVTGRSLPELCRERLPRGGAVLLWLQAESVAMATDMAEFVGAVVGLRLLFGMPLMPALVATAILAFGICALQRRGHRRLETAIVFLLLSVFGGLVYDLFAARPDLRASAAGLVPGGLGKDAGLLLAVGIVGATVMPHVIYLHSDLTSRRVHCRNDGERARMLRFERLDVVLALGLAGVVNASMLAIAASIMHGSAHSPTVSLIEVHSRIAAVLGGGAALAFAVALFASGISSSGVGTLAGQSIMQGFTGYRMPQLVRRAITMAPAIVLLSLHVNATLALLISQVVLSFGVPFALIPLLLLTANRELMRVHVNRRITTALMVALTVCIVFLNLLLLLRLVSSA
jgi:manganese transport protein